MCVIVGSKTHNMVGGFQSKAPLSILYLFAVLRGFVDNSQASNHTTAVAEQAQSVRSVNYWLVRRHAKVMGTATCSPTQPNNSTVMLREGGGECRLWVQAAQEHHGKSVVNRRRIVVRQLDIQRRGYDSFTFFRKHSWQ